MKTARFPQTLSRGFTLIELMIVITVIGILSTIALVGFGQIQKTARDSQRLQTIKGVQAALECYQASYGSYPAEISDTVSKIPWNNFGGGTGSPDSTTFGKCYPSSPAGPTDPSSTDANKLLNASGTVPGLTTVSYGYTTTTTGTSCAGAGYMITLTGETKTVSVCGPR